MTNAYSNKEKEEIQWHRYRSDSSDIDGWRDSQQNQQINKFLCRALMLSVTLPRPLTQWGMAVSRQPGGYHQQPESNNHQPVTSIKFHLSQSWLMSSSCCSAGIYYHSQPAQWMPDCLGTICVFKRLKPISTLYLPELREEITASMWTLVS